MKDLVVLFNIAASFFVIWCAVRGFGFLFGFGLKDRKILGSRLSQTWEEYQASNKRPK